MKKNVIKILLIICTMFVFTAQGLAEPPGYLDKPPTKEQKDRVRQRIETLKMWKLTKALDLDETNSAKIFPILNRYDKQRDALHQELRAGMRALRQSLRENKTDELKNTLNMLEENHKALQSIDEEEWAEMKKVLTIEQQAKFVLFRQEFDREVRKIIADARERRKGRGVKSRGERP